MTPPVPYVVSIAVDAVIDSLGAFIGQFVSGCPIVRGQQNRVAPPPGAFVKLTEVLQVGLSTPIVCNQFANSQQSIMGKKRIDIQVDFYGPAAGEQIAAVTGTYRTEWCASQFPAGIAPLYCSDPRQAPLTTGEQQYDDKWTMTASLQFNPVVYVPVQFATALKMNIVDDLV